MSAHSRRPTERPTANRVRMLGLLASLPAPSDPGFPQAVRRVLDEVDGPEPALRSVLDEPSVRPQVRFAALYGLLLRMRREERYGVPGN